MTDRRDKRGAGEAIGEETGGAERKKGETDGKQVRQRVRRQVRQVGHRH